ncbi:MAG: TonB-dependent receptor [Acidobacteriaceae bacterium]|nr:TonB-dependent receptor [Acidobacteriaceae bacterium]
MDACHRSRDVRITGCSLVSACFAVLFARQASAQLLQGTIDGNVTDSSQAAIVGATVTAQNQETSFTRDTVTNAAGEYTLATLPPGTYIVAVKARGFETYTQTGIVVNANEVTRANVVMVVGRVNETVTVSAQAAALQTDRADVRTDLTTKTLNNLPTPLGRNYQLLLPVTVPGVATPVSGGSFAANPSRAVQITVNGTTGWGNNTRIDGTSSTDYNGIYPMYTPALESIETINVVTNSFDAEQGLAGGAAINIQSKTGTNAIHGSLFEYHADQHLKAYAWNADRTQAQPKYINNQFGGTIGGPILKNKLFYFVSYEGTYIRQEAALYSQVPTPAMKAGDLSASPTQIYDPMTGNANGTGRTPFPGKLIPPTRIDLGIAAILATNQWPNPNVPGTGALGLARNYLSSGNNGQSRNQWDSKLNWNPSNKFSMFARFGINQSTWFNPQQYGPLGGPGYSPSNSASGTGGGFIYSGTLSGTYIFTPNLIADAYVGYSRNDANTAQERLNENLGSTLLHIPGLESSQAREGGWPALEIDGFGGPGTNIPEATLGPNTNFQPQVLRNIEKEWVGNITWITGTHNFRAGLDFDQQRTNENQEQATFCLFCTGAGGFQFSQGTTQLNASGAPSGNDYNAFASFLLGLPSNAGKVNLFVPEYHSYANILGTYIRDQWQATHKLTLTYGTRWEYYPFITRGNRGMEYLDTSANQMIICGVDSNPRNCGITKDTHRFAPRAGIAYRLTDSTVIRAGFGLTNDPTNLGGQLGNRQNYPDILATAITAPNSFSYATTLRIGLPAAVPPDYSSGRVAVPLTAGVYTVDNTNYVRGYVQSWNFTVEQQIQNWTASTAYVATRSLDPIVALNLNWSPIGTGTAGQILNRLSGRTAQTNMIGTMGTNKYDSLQARAAHRFAHGFQFSATYTYARGLGYTTQVAIPYDFRLNYGPLSTIAEHSIGLTLFAEAPFGKGKQWLQTGVGSRLLGGWQFEGVSILRTGTPFTVTASNTTLNAVGSSQFGDCISTPDKIGSIYQWYDRSAFRAPAAGRFGTCGTDSLWGPGLVNADVGLARNFNLSERFQLKFRAQAFNVANNPHHAIPSGNISNATFMQALNIANTGREGIDERTFLLSLHVAW